MSAEFDWSRYEIDPARGFLPALDPLTRLPEAFACWETLAPRVSALLLNGRLRDSLRDLPVPDSAQLETRAELERAMLLLSVFGGAYVWGGAETADVIPRTVAVPWCDVARRLGRPPIVAHASIVLSNWRRVDAAGPIALDNLETLQQFRGGGDEQWFYLIPVAMEARGAEALRALVRARGAAASSHVDEVVDGLETIGRVVHDLTEILGRTPEHCDPYIFYHRVRPFLAGWPEPGIIYQGVSESPVRLSGGSAAQSSLFQAIDAGLGIEHDDERSRPFLLAMRAHMPPAHRRFLEDLEASSYLRDFVLERSGREPTATRRYNAAVSEVERFRKAHFEMAVRYISRQAPEGDEALGTGGSELKSFLRTTRDETRAKLIGG